MTHRGRIYVSAIIGLLTFPQAYALLNFNDGKDLVFVNASYTIGFDSNVFTRATAKASFTQTAAAGIDYTRQAGLIGVNVSVNASMGQFDSVRSQNFTDPSVSVSLRKRYGRTTGSLVVSARHESQPDPDVGQRTQAWNYNTGLDLRYPVNDRYYITNGVNSSFKFYSDSHTFSNLDTLSDAIAVNYVYTSKLDLNGGYAITVSDTSKNTKAYDQSLTIGASGGLLPKLSGSIHVGVVRRDSHSTAGGRETFNSFASGTSVKWLYSRKLSFTGDLTDDFSTTATDLSVNRLSGGLHGTAALSSRYIPSAGVTYTISKYLGKAGAGRQDELFQFDASVGVAITTHIRTSLSYVYMLNHSNSSGAQFERQFVSLTIIATY